MFSVYSGVRWVQWVELRAHDSGGSPCHTSHGPLSTVHVGGLGLISGWMVFLQSQHWSGHITAVIHVGGLGLISGWMVFL